MNAEKRHSVAVLLVLGFVLGGLTILNGCKKEEPSPKPTDANQAASTGGGNQMNSEMAMATDTAKEIAGTEQTTCPVMGNPIDKQYSIEYEGKKVYFCCPGCESKFTADPAKYIAKLPQFSK